MAAKTFAAVYIGTYEVSLKIFEISAKKHIREIDSIRSRIDLALDVYKNGSIGYEKVEELCEILCEFSHIMKGYRVSDHEVYTSAALRDAKNALFVTHQIYLRTGFNVSILSNSEYRFMGYKSVAGREMFEEMIKTSAAVVDVGGAGSQITLFSNGKLITTQHIEMGTVRLWELLSNKGQTVEKYQLQIEEFIAKKLEVFKSFYLKMSVDNIIFMSDYCMEIISHLNKNKDLENTSDSVIAADDFLGYIAKLQTMSIEGICRELSLSNDKDPLILPSILLFKATVNTLSAKEVWVPGVDIGDGVAYDYAIRNRLIRSGHDFDADVLTAADNLSKHFNSYSPHIDALLAVANKIFEAMKKVHGMKEREKLLLQVAVILHDCGKYVSLANSPRCAYEIIMASEIIGLTHYERQIVALTVLYNTLALDDYRELSDKLDEKGYLTVAKLSAILRVSNALDQSHKQKFENIHMSVKDRELVITVETVDDISLEQALFNAKTAYFENVFSMKPVLKEKRGAFYGR